MARVAARTLDPLDRITSRPPPRVGAEPPDTTATPPCA